jgi:hypothetical protein
MVSLTKFCDQISILQEEFKEKVKTQVHYLKRQSNKTAKNLNKQFCQSLLEIIRLNVPCTSNAQVLNWPEGTTPEEVRRE